MKSLREKKLPKQFRFSSTDLGHEAQLLLCCARTHMDAVNAGRIIALLQENIDWSLLLQMAISHNVASLLYRNLEVVCPNVIPENARTQLKEQIQVDIQSNLFLTKELLQLLALFDQHYIRAVPYKGPLLAASVYGDLALRPFGDLDILVHERDVLQAKDLLLSCGYQIIKPLAVAQTIKSLQSLKINQLVANSLWAYQLVLSHPDRQVLVELHWRVTPKYMFPMRPEQLWENLRPTLVARKMVLSFAPEQLLWFLCVHGTKHHWTQLNWICDIAELLRTYPNLNWEQLVVQAKKSGIERRFYLGLLLANRLLNAPIPEKIETELGSTPQVRALAQQVIDSVFDGAHATPDILHIDWLVFDLKAMDRIADRGRYLWHLAYSDKADRVNVRLTPYMAKFYDLLKRIRLATIFGRDHSAI